MESVLRHFPPLGPKTSYAPYAICTPRRLTPEILLKRQNKIFSISCAGHEGFSRGGPALRPATMVFPLLSRSRAVPDFGMTAGDMFCKRRRGRSFVGGRKMPSHWSSV